MEPIISVSDLGKSYRIRTSEKKRYRTLRDDLSDGIKNILQGKFNKPETKEFWALRDINLDIYPGEVVGIIGRNGAGKSTLLKILARITQPTTGKAVMKGRVASLLEVGTGFHPELTGRENIFMSGTVLGMKRQEIKKNFDEIVAFAEVEKFLDTPVKRYSSGMYVRLAFAVAAHLEPEILIVDEVLAVGDVEFQKKCLGKMEKVSKDYGRTVLFVSHNMSAVSQLTTKCILLIKGYQAKEGASEDIIREYLEPLSREDSSQSEYFYEKPTETLDPHKEIEFLKLSLENQQTLKKIFISINYVVRSFVRSVVAVRLENSHGIILATIRDTDLQPENFQKKPGLYTAEFSFPTDFLVPGNYYLTFSLADMVSKRYEFIEKKLTFEIAVNESDLTPGWSREGFLALNPSWRVEKNL